MIRATTKEQRNNQSRKFVSNSVLPIFIHDSSFEPASTNEIAKPRYLSCLKPYGSAVLREDTFSNPAYSFPTRLAYSLLPAVAVFLQTYPIATGLDPAVTPTPAPDDFRSRSVKKTGWRTAGLYLFCVSGGETCGVWGAACWQLISTYTRTRVAGFVNGGYCNLRVILSDGTAVVRGAFYIVFLIILSWCGVRIRACLVGKGEEGTEGTGTC